MTEDMSYTEKANIAEASVIGKQIANYKEIAQLESDVAIARTNVLTTNEGTPEHAAVQDEFSKVESKYKAAIETEASLIDERKSINAVQAEAFRQRVQKAQIDFERMQRTETRDDIIDSFENPRERAARYQDMDKYNAQIAAERASASADRSANKESVSRDIEPTERER